MFVVPLAGDVIETVGAVKHTVLSYSAYRKNPTLYVEDGINIAPVVFDDIIKLNGTPVKYVNTILVASSKISRKYQLPQQNDKVKVNARTIKVKHIKVFERGNISSGMQIAGIDLNTDEPIMVRLINISGIERANGDTSFSQQPFQMLYKDYLGSI